MQGPGDGIDRGRLCPEPGLPYCQCLQRKTDKTELLVVQESRLTLAAASCDLGMPSQAVSTPNGSQACMRGYDTDGQTFIWTGGYRRIEI